MKESSMMGRDFLMIEEKSREKAKRGCKFTGPGICRVLCFVSANLCGSGAQVLGVAGLHSQGAQQHICK